MYKFIFLIAISVILSSCSDHVSRSDGPPAFYVDENKIPDAVPKPEPLAKYGNMKSYRVLGATYHPLKSCHGFQEMGIASWYGSKFHNRNTSSGEPYNMLAMTAAHKTLPLPTYVEVTNLQNHKKIIVKVNDRGPFAANRIIDLSYVAAKKLGMLGHGTAPVKIKAINPYTYAKVDKVNVISPQVHSKSILNYREKHPSAASNITQLNFNHHLYLQVGVFKSKYNAEKYRHKISALLNIPVQITSEFVPAEIFKVHVGPIKDKKTASKLTQQLKTNGIKAHSIYL